MKEVIGKTKTKKDSLSQKLFVKNENNNTIKREVSIRLIHFTDSIGRSTLLLNFKNIYKKHYTQVACVQLIQLALFLY